MDTRNFRGGESPGGKASRKELPASDLLYAGGFSQIHPSDIHKVQ